MTDQKSGEKKGRVNIEPPAEGASELTDAEMKKVKGGTNTFNLTFGSQTTPPPQGTNTGNSIGGALGPDELKAAFGDGSVRNK